VLLTGGRGGLNVLGKEMGVDDAADGVDEAAEGRGGILIGMDKA